jgi:hypothetical protein
LLAAGADAMTEVAVFPPYKALSSNGKEKHR